MTKHTLLRGVTGSHAYGLAHATSDVDRLEVFVYDTSELLLLNSPKDSICVTNPDITKHELKKFLSLALKCNPTVTELLWLDDWEHWHSTWGPKLVELRYKFLSQHYIRNAYLGYATQQLKRLETYGRYPDVPINRIEKHGRHLLRLIEQGSELWRTGRVTLKVDDPERFFQFGRDVSEDPDIARETLHNAELAFDERTPLPAHPETETIEEFLLDVRYRFM